MSLLLAILQEHEAAEAAPGLMDIRINLMFWTLVIFLVLFFILKKWAFPAILGSVEAREKALEDAIERAKRDREEAAKLLAEHKTQIHNARNEAQKLIAEGRPVAEQMPSDMLE